jgi:hypothetical protein
MFHWTAMPGYPDLSHRPELVRETLAQDVYPSSFACWIDDFEALILGPQATQRRAGVTPLVPIVLERKSGALMA